MGNPPYEEHEVTPAMYEAAIQYMRENSMKWTAVGLFSAMDSARVRQPQPAHLNVPMPPPRPEVYAKPTQEGLVDRRQEPKKDWDRFDISKLSMISDNLLATLKPYSFRWHMLSENERERRANDACISVWDAVIATRSLFVETAAGDALVSDKSTEEQTCTAMAINATLTSVEEILFEVFGERRMFGSGNKRVLSAVPARFLEQIRKLRVGKESDEPFE